MTTLAWNLKNCGSNPFLPYHMRAKHESRTAVISSRLLRDFGNISKLETREVGFPFISNSSESSVCIVGKLNYICSLFLKMFCR